MSGGGLSKKLVDFIKLFLGRITGGLSLVTIAASMFFAAISGSCPATTAAIGGVMIPEMNKSGYDKKFSAAAAGELRSNIPPYTVTCSSGSFLSTLFLTVWSWNFIRITNDGICILLFKKTMCLLWI